MEQLSELPPGSEAAKTEPRPGPLLARMYGDVGLAAVANALEIPTDDLDVELGEAIRRGARYLFLMPKVRLPKVHAPAW